MDKNEILERLKRNPQFIEEIDDNEEYKLFIVKNNGTNIKYIKNPSKNVQIEAVKDTVFAIKYIENLHEDVALMCVKSSWNALELIKEPSDNVIEEAIKTKGWAIKYITNPSEKLQLIAVGKDYDAIKYIKDPSEEVQIRAIDNYYAAIKYIEKPTLNAKIEAVRQNGEAINYISNYDLDDVKMFISVNINVVKYVYESIDPELVVEVLTDKFKDENIDDKYIRDFLELEILEMNKIEFVREYGNKKTKKALVDYKLSM